MAVRESKPGTDYANDGVNGYIPFVWPDNADLFNHVQLAANWDAIDGHLGRHEKVLARLGDLKLWYRVIAGTSPPTGWVVCDGSLVAAVSHDFSKTGANQRDGNGVGVGADNQLRLPDFRGKTFMGADVAHVNGTAAAVGDANAPGPGGHQGSNEEIVTPDHFHRFNHIHRTGGVTGVETMHAVETDPAAGGLNDNLHSSPVYVDTDASGSGNRLTKQAHAHQLAAMYTTMPRVPENDNQRLVDAPGQPASSASDASSHTRNTTSLQMETDGTNRETTFTGDSTDSVTETPGGGTPGDDLSMDARPASIGVVVLMYVKLAT